MELAVELVDELPATLAGMRAGRLDGYRGRVIADETRPLEPIARRNAEATILRKATVRPGHSCGQPRGRSR